MKGGTNDIPTFRFSTDALPERDRLPVMREVVGRSLARADFEPLRGVPFQFRCVARVLPGLGATSSSLSGLICRRTREYLADGNDDVALCVIRAPGGNRLTHLGRELVSSGSHTYLVSTADVLVSRAISMPRCLTVALPRRAMVRMVPSLEDTFLQPIPMNSEALRLLTSYVRLLDGPLTLTTPEIRREFVGHVYDLAALALGASRDAAEAAKDRGVRAARLHAIKADIVGSSHQHDLTLARLPCAMASPRGTCRCCLRARGRPSRGSCSTSVWPARIAC